MAVRALHFIDPGSSPDWDAVLGGNLLPDLPGGFALESESTGKLWWLPKVPPFSTSITEKDKRTAVPEPYDALASNTTFPWVSANMDCP